MTVQVEPYGIPERFRSEKFQVPAGRESIFFECGKWVKGEDKRWCLSFAGISDTGKTMSMVSCFDYFIFVNRNSVTALFITFLELLHKLDACFGRNADMAAYVESLIDYDLLAIDDFLIFSPNEYQMLKIQYILEKRYNRKKKTMLTSNANAADVKRKLGDAQYRRLFSDKDALYIEFEGKPKIHFKY